MNSKFLKHNNIVPLIGCIISGIVSFGVAYMQIKADKSVDAMDSEKVRSIATEQIDLKLAPVNVKLDMLLEDIEQFKHNQDKISEAILDWLKNISNRNPVALNTTDKTQEIKDIQIKNQKLFQRIRK